MYRYDHNLIDGVTARIVLYTLTGINNPIYKVLNTKSISFSFKAVQERICTCMVIQLELLTHRSVKTSLMLISPILDTCHWLLEASTWPVALL